MPRLSGASAAVCVVILACAGCSDSGADVPYHPTAPVSRPALDWELLRYLSEGEPGMYFCRDGRLWIKAVALTDGGTCRVVRDVVCTRREGATHELCANLSIGPQGPKMSEWREVPIPED